MGMDYYLLHDQIEKSHKELKDRLSKINFNNFLNDLKLLCFKYNLFLTEANANNEFRLFEYIFDESKENIDSKIWEAYCGGSLTHIGEIDRLNFTLFYKIDPEG